MTLRSCLAGLVLAACAFRPEPTGIVPSADDDDASLDETATGDDVEVPETGASSDTGTVDACVAVRGRTFLSVDALECGLGPDGVVLCPWSVTLDVEGTFTWSFSDVGASGVWSCRHGFIQAQPSGDAPSIDGFYDVKSDQLTWDGVLYE